MKSLKSFHLVGISTLCLGGIAVGSALHLPAMAAQVYQQYLSPDTTCTSSSPCTTTTNNGSGPASANTSVGGTGLTGATKFVGTSKTKFAVGVLGSDLSTKGKYDAGVEGTSVSGTGALGSTKSGTGVSGVATTGTGVSGVSTSGTGLVGTSTSGTGLYASSSGLAAETQSSGNSGIGLEAISNVSATNGTGILSYANGTGGVGVSANGASFGLQATGVTGVQAQGGNSGSAFEADSNGGLFYTGYLNGTLNYVVDRFGNVESNGGLSGANASFNETGGGVPTLSAGNPEGAINAVTTDPSSATGAVRFFTQGGPFMQGYNGSTLEFTADGAGNIFMNGLIYTGGGCSSGCIAHGPVQKRVVSYTPRESQPTMEDFGEGQLVNGVAHVALDPAFANVMNQNASYLVFAMPEGDCNGLFIAAKSKTGFDVRELRGGHSTLSFEYRIVAKPFGDHSARLPMVELRSQANNSVFHTMPRLKPATRG
ncbi:MAG TPA: hypothetical protein VKT51_11285 [Candidatus Eremiobacteraceae bacterium]|nr:hypothetical protein [Candidatus Eremiobacteraceae bacterium]